MLMTTNSTSPRQRQKKNVNILLYSTQKYNKKSTLISFSSNKIIQFQLQRKQKEEKYGLFANHLKNV